MLLLDRRGLCQREMFEDRKEHVVRWNSFGEAQPGETGTQDAKPKKRKKKKKKKLSRASSQSTEHQTQAQVHTEEGSRRILI